MYYLCKQKIAKSTLQMSNKIKHTGMIENIEDGCVMVRFVQSSACSACKVASHCHASESKEKMIEVATPDASLYHPGDRVNVVADTAVGFRASLYGYLLPLVLMVAALVGVVKATQSEAAAALSALGILVPYYAILYLCRNKLKTKLSFSIER